MLLCQRQTHNRYRDGLHRGQPVFSTQQKKRGRDMKYQNYIFDLYGTLVDIRTNEKKPSVWKKMTLAMNLGGMPEEEHQLRMAYRKLSKIVQKHLVEQRTRQLGVEVRPEDVEINLEKVFAQLFVDRGAKPDERRVRDFMIFYRTLTLEKLQLFEEAKPLLHTLHKNKKKVYLLSNAQRAFAEPEMRYLGINKMFDGICYSSDVGLKKPSSLYYSYFFQRYGLSKKTSVVIGNDWQEDAWAACKYGVDSMYIHTQQSPEVTGKLPDNCVTIHSLRDVLEV